MKDIERVVVDEGVGRDSALEVHIRARLGERPVAFVFVANEHPGIPDIEIFDKLLDRRTVLLTKDRALHNLAIGRGFRSFVDTPESGLTDRRLPYVAVKDRHLPVARGAPRDSYHHHPSLEARSIKGSVFDFLSAHQLKQFRTKRRRIRAHFGSADNIGVTALTIGQRKTARGVVGGYFLKVDSRNGVKGLFPASENYFLDTSGNEPMQATCWALLHLFQLQLQEYPLTLFQMDGVALARCTALIADPGAAVTPIERMAARLLAAMRRPVAEPCTKGRFHDRASDKLNKLAKFDTNELVPCGLNAVAAALIEQAPSTPSDPWSADAIPDGAPEF